VFQKACSRINTTKYLASGAVNVREPRSMPQVGSVCVSRVGVQVSVFLYSGAVEAAPLCCLRGGCGHVADGGGP